METSTRSQQNNAVAAVAAAFIVLVVELLGSPAAMACYYGKYGFQPSSDTQSDIKSLIYDRYEHHEPSFYRAAAMQMKPQLASHQDDPDFLDEYALTLYQGGNAQQAESIWRDLLKRDPKRYVTLCNFGTALHDRGKLPEAYAMLKTAYDEKPDVRGGAEKWHLRMIDYLMKTRVDPSYGRNHLFVDELTPVWRDHQSPSKSFHKVALPVDAMQGVTELLHQFPRFGDGWLVAGMLLEHEREYDLAKLSYERAAKYGTAQAGQLSLFLPQFKAFQDKGSRIRAAGRGMLILVCFFIGVFVLRYLSGLFLAIRRDRMEAKKRVHSAKTKGSAARR
jgi:tetratricopeptide (TPR) repeat protein